MKTYKEIEQQLRTAGNFKASDASLAFIRQFDAQALNKVCEVFGKRQKLSNFESFIMKRFPDETLRALAFHVWAVGYHLTYNSREA